MNDHCDIPEGSSVPYRWLLENSPEAVILVREHTIIEYASPRAESLLGLPMASLVGTRFSDYLHDEEDASLLSSPAWGTVESPGTSRLELCLRRVDGLEVYVAASPSLPPEVEGRPLVAWYLRDETERRAREESLIFWAHRDPLTGLVSRGLFMDRLGQALYRAERKNTQVSVLYLDLDDFKLVNDSLGHAAGDRLLAVLADRITACLRQGDTAARLGGDEFAILVEDLEDTSDAYHLAERLAASLRDPVIVWPHALDLVASIGVASSGAGLDTAEGLLEAADAAMYVMKRASKAGHESDPPRIISRTEQSVRLETEFREAALRRQLEVYYQPMIHLDSRRAIAFEALLRWRHPLHGMILPEQYMDFAARSGLILSVGAWVLARACKDACGWDSAGSGDPPMVSVNLSELQLRQPDIVRKITRVLEGTGLLAGRLVLEIPENLRAGDLHGLKEKLRRLQELGVRLAVDDFGTGSSWFSYLRHLPADWLKIDRQFIEGLGRDDERETGLAASCINLAHALGASAVAEGVEETTQLTELERLGCEIVQGNLLSEPVPNLEVPGLIEEQPWKNR